MKNSQYRYDPERKEFVTSDVSAEPLSDRREVVRPEGGPAAEPSNAPVQMQRRRRRRRSSSLAGSFAEGGRGRKSRGWWLLLWVGIAAMVMAWMIFLLTSYEGEKRELKADSLHHIDKEKVVPDL